MSVVRIACCLFPLLALVALETIPEGVLAIPVPDQERDGDRVLGGAAVLIDDDGLALTLAEAIPDPELGTFAVILPGGRRGEATVVRRGEATTAVLLRITAEGRLPAPLATAASDGLAIGDTVWTLGNPFGALETDGRPAVSKGVVSGLYPIPVGSPPARGRRGKILSTYRGPVIENTAATNDGNQGGALVDDAGRLVGLASLGVARDRRLGTAVPLAAIVADLAFADRIEPAAPAAQDDPVLVALRDHAARLADGLALVYFERPQGLGNPDGMARPRPITDRVPPYRRKQLKERWERYYHQQQRFFTDQAVTAIVIDPERGLLVTSRTNLHGGAREGRLVGRGDRDGGTIQVFVRHVDPTHDLALLQADRPLPHARAPLAAEADLATGDPVAVLGRHRHGGAFTMTTGVVSATERRPPGAPGVLHQTDALANYGNLGGPVIDLAGRVVGMMGFLDPGKPWFTNSGVAMFVDSRRLAAAVERLAEPKVGLGVSLSPDERPLEIRFVFPDSAADRAGLRVGDRLLRLDDQAIGSLEDLVAKLDGREEGDAATLRIRRGDEELHVEVELREF